MKRGAAIWVIMSLCACLLAGCWDYRGMDDLNIVTGVAVDIAEDDQYELTLEIVDINSMTEGGGKGSILVTTRGPTLFEAVRNAKKRLYNRLYFGNMRLIIISQELAREEGITEIVTGLLRDVEPRETIFPVISQEDSARSLIATKGLDVANVSYEIAQIIEEDQRVNATSKRVQLFEAYNDLQAEGIELVLPAFHIAVNDGEEVAESHGIAVFHGDKLAGFMPPEESYYYLMAVDQENGGAMSFPDRDAREELIAVEIMNCKNRSDIHYQDGVVFISVTVDLECKIIEFPGGKSLSSAALEGITQQVEEVVASRITQVFQETQRELGLDIYGFGKRIYQDKYPLWLEIADQWTELFKSAEFDARVNATMVDVGITY